MGTLVVGGILGAIVALSYLTIGAFVARNARARPLMRGFVVFWYGVGGYALVESSWVLAAALFGFAPFWLGVVVLHLKIATLLAGFGGLVAYLIGIYSGSRRATWLAGAAYALVWIFVEYVYALRGPSGQHVATWGLQLDYAHPNVEPLWTLMLALLIVPPTLATLAYARLWRVSADAAQRRRILVTSASLLLFLVPSFVAWRAGSWYWWGPTEKALTLLAALGMFATAYSATREERLAALERLASARRARALEDATALRRRVHDLL